MSIQSGLVQYHDSLEPFLTTITEVRPHPDNPRNGDIEAIAESIEVNGFVAPIIAQASTGHIIAGNHRYFACMQMEAKEIPVVWVDMDDSQARRYLLADNRTSDLGQYDNGQLVRMLSDLAKESSLGGTGYTDQSLEQLKALAEMEPEYGDHASWPTISLTVPPHLKNAFYDMTEHAQDDRERLEMLLTMAGWEK